MNKIKILFPLFLLLATYTSIGCAKTTSRHNTIASTHQAAKEIVVKTKDAQLFCRVFGQGDPILIIHGGPGLSQDYLLPQMTELAKNNLLIFYDQRGCGHSTGEITSDTMQLQTFVNDLETIRQFFKYDQVTVLGHSWGAFLAMNYAIAYPKGVHKLILLNAHPPSFEEYGLFEQEIMKRLNPCLDEFIAVRESPEFAQGDPIALKKYCKILFEKYFYHPANAQLLNLSFDPETSKNGSKVSELFTQNLFLKPHNIHDQLKQLKVPTLIIHGDSDPIPLSIAQRLHEDIKGSQYFLLKHCGHFPYVETPDEFFQHLNAFLRQDGR